MQLWVNQPGRTRTSTLDKVALVPDLGQNLLLAKQTSRISGQKISICNYEASLGSGENSWRFHSGGLKMHVMEATQSAVQVTAVDSTPLHQRDVMELHKL